METLEPNVVHLMFVVLSWVIDTVTSRSVTGVFQAVVLCHSTRQDVM